MSHTLELLARDVVRTLSLDCRGRHFGNPRRLDEAAYYIGAQFLAGSGHVKRRTWVVGGEVYRNVSALFGKGERPRLVVGAHYDSVPGSPGADDNASGVAGLVLLSKMLSDHRHQDLPVDVELVAWSLEEPPIFGTSLMGSAIHAGDLRARGVDVVGAVALEMIGFFSDEQGSQWPPEYGSHRDIGDYMFAVSTPESADFLDQALAGLAGGYVEFDRLVAPRDIPGVDLSDHASYWDMGFKAMMLTDGAFTRNDNYHAPSDLPDTLDYALLADVAKSVGRMCLRWPKQNKDIK